MLALREFPTMPFNQLRREMGRMLENFNLLDNGFAVRPFPALNIWADADNLYAEAELPGLSAEDVEVQVIGNELSIKGRRPQMTDESITFHRQERGVGEFARVLTLPVEVNPEKVEAKLLNGLLTIRMPKADASRARKIAVKSV